MAKGQKTFSTSGRKVTKMEFKPLPPGEYELKLNAKQLEIKVKAGPGNLPYINAALEALGTGGDSGKNRRVYHRFFLDTTPSKKDGVAMVDRGAGIVAFARAVGQDLDGVSIQTINKSLDDGSTEPHDVLNAKEVLKYLTALDGSVFSGKVKVVPADGNYGPKNEIEYFIESENAAEESDDDDEDEDEDDAETDEADEDGDGEEDESEEDDDEEDDEDDGEDEDEEEDVPAPKSKVKQGPAGRKPLKKKKK